MAVKEIHVKCDWCETQAVYSGLGIEQQVAGDGWFTFVPEDSEESQDYCCFDCWLSAQ